jgi:hypothetical protein
VAAIERLPRALAELESLVESGDRARLSSAARAAAEALQ